MMDWTDRHCRVFHRTIAPDALLYTEMVTSGAVIHGERGRLLGFHPAEHPVGLQLGGSEPEALREAAAIGAAWGYDEINLNVGCPSDRVQSGRFGACLMREPALVRDCIRAMQAEVDVPVTVKSRIGLDEDQGFEPLERFVATVAESGCRTFIVHARNAWLQGLNPKENRSVPPLHYDLVYRLKQTYPELEVVINGGIQSLGEVQTHLSKVDGVMLGRAAYQNPWLLHDIQAELFPASTRPTCRAQVVQEMTEYLRSVTQDGVAVKHVTRHLLGLFHARPGGKHWRRYLSQNAHRTDADASLLAEAMLQVTQYASAGRSAQAAN